MGRKLKASGLQKAKGKKDKPEKSETPEHVEKISGLKNLNIDVGVCGDPDVIALFMEKKEDIETPVDRYQVKIYAQPGNDENGRMMNSTAPFLLCVYDVRNVKSVGYLRNRILPEVKRLNKKFAVAGLGLEYRSGMCRGETSIETAANLNYSFGCRCNEIISCDGAQMAAGIFALYVSTCPELFDQGHKVAGGRRPGWFRAKETKDKELMY